MNDLITVITPYYNTPQYIFDEYLQALVNQTYQNFKAIVVDDGSKEEYGAYLESLKAKLPDNVTVIRKENGGASSARNHALSLLFQEPDAGGYITFVDSDDLIDPCYLENLHRALDNGKYALSFCERGDFADSASREGIFTNEACGYEAVSVLDVIRRGSFGYCTGWLFPLELVSDLRFDENIKLCEDQKFSFECIGRAKSDCGRVSGRALYYYRKHGGNATAFMKSADYLSAIAVSDEILESPFVRDNDDIYRGRINHKAYWMIRYMLALCREKPARYRREIKSRIAQFKREIKPYLEKGNKFVSVNSRLMFSKTLFLFFLKIESKMIQKIYKKRMKESKKCIKKTENI